jgi:hypothetical protein
MLEHWNVAQLRKPGTAWLGKPGGKLPRDTLVKALRKLMEDDRAAAEVLRTVSAADLPVLAAYKRYGGTVNGAVIRIDLLARGLLEKVVTHSYGMSWGRWQRNPVEKLAERWLLLSPDRSGYGYFYGGYGQETERPFLTYSLQAGIAQHVEPAGPPPWRLTAVAGTPVPLGSRSSAEVALDLAQVFSYVSARGQVKYKKSGGITTPALRALAREVPLAQDDAFPLPDAHALYLELLTHAGAVHVEDAAAQADSTAATKLFTMSTARQAHLWARGWILAGEWRDGLGAQGFGDVHEAQAWDTPVATQRQMLAWALASLAHAPISRQTGTPWFELTHFLEKLHSIHGDVSGGTPVWSGHAWDARLAPARDKETKQGQERQNAYWYAGMGNWYANALMITLVQLGLLERGRVGSASHAQWCFRLTPLGRIVFGAPEITPPADEPERRFLVLQPNFDVVAYLDQADAASAGTLGRLADRSGDSAGAVQTFRVTRQSLYQAQESGLTPAQIVDFFQRHNQGELPGNVLRSIGDWSAQRESLVVRSGVTLVGFSDTAGRDAYLAGNSGTACGERFVLLPEAGKAKVRLDGALLIDHQRPGRHTLTLDEYGQVRSDEPYDVLQVARLRRIAQPAAGGWEVTAASVRQAAAAGIKARLIDDWLAEHLREPMPPLLAHAIHAWLGRTAPVEMGEAILLHVPNEEQFEAMVSSPRLQPFWQGSPGKHWLVVRREGRQQLAALLKELGFPVARELTHEPLRGAGAEEDETQAGR